MLKINVKSYNDYKEIIKHYRSMGYEGYISRSLVDGAKYSTLYFKNKVGCIVGCLFLVDNAIF